MKKAARMGITTIATLAVAAVFGCMADTTGIETLSVAELSQKLSQTPATAVCDANGDGVRESYGIIPGAILLTSSSSYDVAAELPESKENPLVFYCSSPRCSAAPSAARRAKDAGYSDVYVLPEGIKGWVEAGKAVANKKS